MEQNKKEYTVKGLADRIKFHEQTIYRWIKSRGLPVHRACENGRVVIYWDEFSEWWKEDKNGRWERL